MPESRIIISFDDEVSPVVQARAARWLAENQPDDFEVNAPVVLGVVDTETFCAVTSLLVSGASLLLQIKKMGSSAPDGSRWSAHEVLAEAQRALIRYGVHSTELVSLVGAEQFYAGDSDVLKVFIADKNTGLKHEVWLKRDGAGHVVRLGKPGAAE